MKPCDKMLETYCFPPWDTDPQAPNDLIKGCTHRTAEGESKLARPAAGPREKWRNHREKMGTSMIL